MIKFLRRYAMFLAAVLIGGGGVITSYLSEHPPTPQPKQMCYNASGEAVKPEYRANSTLVRVHWIRGTIHYQGEEVEGLAKYVYDAELNASICEVYIPMPERVIGDAAMDTIGHEMLHCLSGAFHD